MTLGEVAPVDGGGGYGDALAGCGMLIDCVLVLLVSFRALLLLALLLLPACLLLLRAAAAGGG